MAKSKTKTSARNRKRQLEAARRREEARMMGLLDAATRERFGGSERVLADETRRVGAHGATIDQAYAVYQGHVAQLAAQQQQQMRDAAAAQAQVAQGVAGAQTALGAGQQQATQETAARYGLDGGQQAAEAAQLAGQLGAVQGARAQAQAGTSAAIGLGQGERLRAASLGGVGAQMRDRKRNQDELAILAGKRADLEGDKGAFRVTLRREIEKQEAEQRLAEAALGVKAADSRRDAELDMLNLEQRGREARSRARDRAADNDRAERKLRADIAAAERRAEQKDTELDLRRQEDANTPKLTKAQSSQWKQKKARILELRKAFNAITENGRFKTTAELSAYLRKNGYKRIEINMARDLSRFGSGVLSAPNITAAQSYFPGGIVPRAFAGG